MARTSQRRTRLLRRYRRLLAVGLVAATLVGVSGTAAQADSEHHVYGTGSDGLWLHSVPSLPDGLIRVLPEGAPFVVQCWTEGPDVNGNPIWLYGSSGADTGYVADYYIDTEWNTTQDLVDQGLPKCGTAEPTPQEAPAPPVNIQLKSNAGQHETDVADLADELSTAASRVNINGQTLARVIYHEGGNYFSPRRSATELKEMAVTSSVGIAQVQIATARLVDLKVYRDWSMVQEPSDLVIRTRLIYDWPYAMRSAAGYLRLLQDEGVTGEWPQFMAYSLSLDVAKAWKETGHSMDRAVLASIGANPDVMIRRQQLFNDAKNAIG